MAQLEVYIPKWSTFLRMFLAVREFLVIGDILLLMSIVALDTGPRVVYAQS